MNQNRRNIILAEGFVEEARYFHEVGMTDTEIAEKLGRKYKPAIIKAGEDPITKQDIYNARTDGAFLPPLEAPPVMLLRPKAQTLVRRKRNDWLTDDSVKLLLESDNEELLDAYTALACTLQQTQDPGISTVRSFRDIMMVLTTQHPKDQVLRTISAMYQLTLAYMETALDIHYINKVERAAQYYSIYKLMLRDGFDGEQALLLWQDFIAEASSRTEDGVIVDDE